MKRITQAEYHKVPWLNGGGYAWDIATEKSVDNQSSLPFCWRFAMAEIETSGLFSSYKSIDRIITLVNGAGFNLSFGQQEEVNEIQLVNRGDFGAFPGDIATHCSLNSGTATVLNIMFARNQYIANVKILDPENFASCEFDCEVLLLFALGGVVELILNNRSICLAESESLILDSNDFDKKIQHTGVNGFATSQLYVAALHRLPQSS